jgi:hypothetical protein
MPRFEKTFARRKRPLTSRAREALELLASDPHGATQAFMDGQGFSLRTLVGLVHARLATVQSEIVIAAGERVSMSVARDDRWIAVPVVPASPTKG